MHVAFLVRIRLISDTVDDYLSPSANCHIAPGIWWMVLSLDLPLPARRAWAGRAWARGDLADKLLEA